MPTKFQLITELYDQTVQSVTGSYQSWTGFLRAACYNYKCPFDEQLLIYAQRPDATAVLEMERWNRQFGRWVNRGAKSIAVFGDDGQNCLKLYFDVSDTHASRFARPLPIWTMHPAFEPEVIETLEATFGNLTEKENLADAVRSACHNAVADNITDYLQDLRECREDSLLEELDDLNLEVFYRDALEVSVAYMLMTRLGLRADDYFTADEFAHVYEFNTPPTINALGIGTIRHSRNKLNFLLNPCRRKPHRLSNQSHRRQANPPWYLRRRGRKSGTHWRILWTRTAATIASPMTTSERARRWSVFSAIWTPSVP